MSARARGGTEGANEAGMTDGAMVLYAAASTTRPHPVKSFGVVFFRSGGDGGQGGAAAVAAGVVGVEHVGQVLQ